MPERPYTPDELQSSILGSRPALTAADVAEASGFEVEEIQRLWRALGFHDAGTDTAFTDADVRALGMIGRILNGGAIDPDTFLRMTRAVGQTMSRLADWEVATLAARVEELEAGQQATGSRIGSALRMVDDVQPIFEQLLLYSWRRHLAAAAGRAEALGAADEALNVAELTVGFADMVGFSAYSNELSQDEIGELVEEFENRCMDAVAGRRGRVIKTLGDSVLFVTERPHRALAICEEIVRQLGAEKFLPDVRMGLATGPVVLRHGDVFGPAVNLAARMTTVARRNRVICDRRTADLLDPAEFDVRELPTRPVRGFGELAPIAVKRRTVK